jgi:hypothetical protein
MDRAALPALPGRAFPQPPPRCLARLARHIEPLVTLDDALTAAVVAL